MGIENFFNVISKSDFNVEHIINNEDRFSATHIFIEFNSIIYNSIKQVEDDLNYLLYDIIINKIDNKSIDILKKYFNVDTMNFSEYLFLIQNINLEKFIETDIIENTIKLVKDYMEDVEVLYISFDGIPNMSKLLEQRKRKYMSYVYNGLYNKLYDKYYLQLPRERIIYENNKIQMEQMGIISWSRFLDNILNVLSSDEFKNEISKDYINFKNVIISSSNEPGESEKKIFDYIYEIHIPNNKYLIFSPDSDLVILSLIANVKLCKSMFSIIRYNFQYNEYIYLDINKFSTKIFTYIQERVIYKELQSNKIINDVCLLFIFMGNDYLPKLETLNTKNSINILIDVYIKHLNTTKNKFLYLTFEENNINKINYETFEQILRRLNEGENKMINELFMASKIKNYSYINFILGKNEHTPYFLDKLNKYCHGYNDVIKYIEDNLHLEYSIKELAQETYNEVIYYFNDKEEWTNAFIRFEGEYILNKNKTINQVNQVNNLNIISSSPNDINNNIILDGYKDSIEIIIDILEGIINNIINNSHRGNLKLSYFNNNIHDKYNQKQIRTQMKMNEKIDITELDLELYKLERYSTNREEDILDNSFGYIEIKFRNNRYKIHVDRNIEENKIKYFNRIFDNQIQQTNDNNKFVDKICEDYIKGIFWTYDFYFNKTNKAQNIQYVSTWMYLYNNTPYLSQLCNYIDKERNKCVMFNQMFYTISDINESNYTQRYMFLTKTEQYLYTTPLHRIKDIPEIYNNILSNRILFPDLNNIIDNIYNGNDYVLNRMRKSYFNKCSINIINNIDYIDFINVVRIKLC